MPLEGRDSDRQSGKLTVRQGKGKKDRELWLNAGARELLRKGRARRPARGALLFMTLAEAVEGMD